MSGLKRLSLSTSLLLARPLARQQKQQHLSSLPLLMHRFCGLYHSLCFLPTSTSTRNYSIVISKSVKFANQSNSAGRKQWPMPLSTKAKCAESEASTQHNLSSVVEKEAEKVAGGETKVYGSSSVPPFTKRTRIIDIKGGPDEGAKYVGKQLLVRGWVRTCRLQKTFSFIEVNDGSTVSNLQAVVSANAEGHEKVSQGLITTGASVLLDGVLMKSQGSKQKVELQVSKLTLVGGSDATTFPVQKKKLSREYLRTIAHLRPRTNTFGAVARVRNALAFATHKFFQNMGFIWIASPIVTAADCEGAGEQFCVTTLIPGLHGNPSTPINKIPCTKDGLVDWSQDFFGKPAYLTVSGQLNAETYATALCDVYTFGPTFRAENSNTSRHLAEFWMIEPELAFADLKDDMACAFAYLQYVVKYVLDNCKEDMEFFSTWIDNDLITRLTNVADRDIIHVTYSDVIDILSRAKKKFEFPVRWGCDLQSEHERYITEEAFEGSPVIVTDYPKVKFWLWKLLWSMQELCIRCVSCQRISFSCFSMRENDDGKTVAAMDLLVPRVGELIGGSQREERLEKLEKRMDELGLNKDSYWWYLDLRRYGTVPHAGFGLGFERLVQFATGIENIRDAIPFPRTPGAADF